MQFLHPLIIGNKHLKDNKDKIVHTHEGEGYPPLKGGLERKERGSCIQDSATTGLAKGAHSNWTYAEQRIASHPQGWP